VELDQLTELSGMRVLDLGCGEGKNAAWLAHRGCDVTAIEVSEIALANARTAFHDIDVKWVHGDVTAGEWAKDDFDLIVAYGLLHCLQEDEIHRVIASMQAATRPDGYNVIVAFNNRSQDLSAHPGFLPTLLDHDAFVDPYAEWCLVHATDTDLHETHPHNNIPHHHSMSRLIAKRP
jgi:cyclopropane fatty-acyl-phospholipid synthase-like methyltransferase